MHFDRPEEFRDEEWDMFAGAERWPAKKSGGYGDPPLAMSCGAGLFVADKNGVDFYPDGGYVEGYKLSMKFPTQAAAFWFLIGLQGMDNDIEDEVALDEVGFVPI